MLQRKRRAGMCFHSPLFLFHLAKFSPLHMLLPAHLDIEFLALNMIPRGINPFIPFWVAQGKSQFSTSGSTKPCLCSINEIIYFISSLQVKTVFHMLYSLIMTSKMPSWLYTIQFTFRKQHVSLLENNSKNVQSYSSASLSCY